jgi:hypothetical protein
MTHDLIACLHLDPNLDYVKEKLFKVKFYYFDQNSSIYQF